jgi:hypothetical protein
MLINQIGIPIILTLIGWLLSQVNVMAKQIKDLHGWHEPNSSGQQTWKGTDPRLLNTLDRLNDTLERSEKHDEQIVDKLDKLSDKLNNGND